MTANDPLLRFGVCVAKDKTVCSARVLISEFTLFLFNLTIETSFLDVYLGEDVCVTIRSGGNSDVRMRFRLPGDFCSISTTNTYLRASSSRFASARAKQVRIAVTIVVVQFPS